MLNCQYGSNNFDIYLQTKLKILEFPDYAFSGLLNGNMVGKICN